MNVETPKKSLDTGSQITNTRKSCQDSSRREDFHAKLLDGSKVAHSPFSRSHQKSSWREDVLYRKQLNKTITAQIVVVW